MEKLKISAEKICSFYVSDWHLVTMILPYINKEINEKANITTVLENNIEKNVTTLLSKLNLKSEKEILEINWGTCQGVKYAELDENFCKNIIMKNATNIILVNGSKDYIHFANQSIDKWIQKHADSFENSVIKVINCYEITDFNNSIREILNMHHKILNTSGEKYIYEVFEGYSEVEEMC